MSYQVIYTPSLIRNLQNHLHYLERENADYTTIDRWYNQLFDAIDSLGQFPNRYPVDKIQSRIANKVIRKMNFGNYLLFFYIDEQRLEVHVSAFKHGARNR